MSSFFSNYVVLLHHLLRILGEIVFIATMGAFGGLAYGVSSLLRDILGNEASKNRSIGVKVSVPIYLLWEGTIGAGGGFAAVFGMLTVGNTVRSGTSDVVTEFPIYVAALCVVGGFVGHRLLAGVGTRLEKKLTDVENRVTSAQQTANDAETRSIKAEMMATEGKQMVLDVVVARDIVNELETSNRTDHELDEGLRSKAYASLTKLHRYKATFPIERTLTLVMANLSFGLGLIEEAFAHLEDFLKERRKAGFPEDEDDISAWFNIACYNALLSYRTVEPDNLEFRDKALAALNRCFVIARNAGPNILRIRLSRARVDPDLRNLITTPPFQALMEMFSPTSEAFG